MQNSSHMTPRIDLLVRPNNLTLNNVLKVRIYRTDHNVHIKD